MARLARLCIVGYPHLITQRGINSQCIFFNDADYAFYLRCIEKALPNISCELNAYSLLDRYAQLIITPLEPSSLSRLMQSIGRDYAQYFNSQYQHTGTIWDGRYRSTVVDPRRHLFASMAYLDWAPVRESLCVSVSEYEYSSYGSYAGRTFNPLLSPPAAYWGLGNTPFARENAYREQVALGLNSLQLQEINDAAQYGWPLGDASFLETIKPLSPTRRVSRGQKGRPVRSVPN
jgi:putative transposase